MADHRNNPDSSGVHPEAGLPAGCEDRDTMKYEPWPEGLVVECTVEKIVVDT